ncbi:hypothetical protein [Rhodoferax sp.]|uniref:hypothetical protein n=1 Tax=Rhodoferax sp. TaxID=50421 RepID=UPI001A03F8AC|nr:hypothetical protein [Rhodoferax sp.]MBE0474579.1 hypothetical protein [Rhodoferax sp.]
MADEPVQLQVDVDAYFRTLAGLKYPQALAMAFPRIVNTLFEFKDNKPKLRGYFDSLIEDARGGRQGFPFDVLMDIQDLREAMLGDVNQFVLDDTTKWVS